MRFEFSSIGTYLFILFLAVVPVVTPFPAEAMKFSFGLGSRPGRESASRPARGSARRPARGSERTTTPEPDGFTSAYDTYIDESRPNNIYGGRSTVSLMERTSRNKAGLLKFNISDIPSRSRVTNAKLSLYVASKSRSARDVSVFAALGNWDESTTWNRRPDIGSFEEGNVVISSTRQYYEWDITQLVQDWVDGVESNNGVYVIANSGDITINSKESRSNRPKLKVDFEEPPPTGGTIDSGVSDAPLEPRDKRILIVAKDRSGNYGTIQSALNNSRPGDTIQVKDGVYNERVNFTVSGTREEPIALVNYPNHRPVIDPGGGSYPAECCPPSGTPRVEFNAEWILLEGFEIQYGWDGVKLYKGHNTVRNNWIHKNRYQGILIISTGDVLIEGNTIEFNGTDPGACYSSEWGGESPKHCHGIYMSDYLCTGLSNITIRGNTLSDHAGRGIQWNGSGCNSEMQNTLVENNIIDNNSWGIALWYNVNRSVVRNNTFVLEQYPETNDTSHTFIGIISSVDNIFKNNVFYSTRGDVAALETFDSVSGQNTFDYNLWKVGSDSWKWEDGWRSDFSSSYKSVTTWDQNSLFNAAPGFYDTTNGIYHLNADSPARDRGENNSCAAIDFDRQNRLVDSGCDIGMDEYYN